jgi:sugar phosphate isomerase/epimerase
MMQFLGSRFNERQKLDVDSLATSIVSRRERGGMMSDSGIHPRISVNGICSRSWSIKRDMEYWAQQGYGLVGVPTYRIEGPLEDTVQALKDSDFRISNMVISTPFSLGFPELWAEQQARIITLLEAASAVEAQCVYMNTGSSRSRMTVDESIVDFIEAVKPASARANELGVRVALEASSQTNHDMGFVHSVDDIFYLADATGLDVVIDLQTAWLERALGEKLRGRMDRVALVQISDYVLGTEKRLSRAVPGDGDIPLEKLINELLENGYEGVFDLELLGPLIEEEGYESAIPRSVEWLDNCLTTLGA